MIGLRLQIDPLPLVEPMVVRLRDSASNELTEHDAILIDRQGDRREYDFNGFSLVVHSDQPEGLDCDVLLVVPGQASAHRLIRATSPHNTFLVTEQCDQLCVMCSQPPKKHHADLFAQFATAAMLAPERSVIGISGGEPLLHKEKLFRMLENVARLRPDVTFHVLSNGQHFEKDDVKRLIDIGTDKILWGIPLYSADPETHDRIVGKGGAFRSLERGLGILMQAGASVELRTVVLQQNRVHLGALADFVFTRLSFINVWALMQLERIGYARMNWATSFLDTSTDFEPISTAIDRTVARGILVALYNFPLCSVPKEYRQFAPSTISDWKRKYLGFCTVCDARSACGGFFEWYSHDQGFSGLGPL